MVTYDYSNPMWLTINDNDRLIEFMITGTLRGYINFMITAKTTDKEQRETHSINIPLNEAEKLAHYILLMARTKRKENESQKPLKGCEKGYNEVNE